MITGSSVIGTARLDILNEHVVTEKQVKLVMLSDMGLQAFDRQQVTVWKASPQNMKAW